MVFEKFCITTRTKQEKSEPFLDKRRVRIFCFLRKAECRGCAAMKAPVGLLSGRAVLCKQDGGALPRQAPARSRRLCVRNLIVILMDTGCVELLLRDGRKISINCTGVEDALDVTMAQRSELDYLIYNDPLGYADLILNGNPKEYLRNVAGSHGLEN